MQPPDDLEARRPVWLALAQLYLDTDPALFLDSIVRDLAASPYDLDELERILVHEVHPVCAGNLRTVAGEWAAFDEPSLLDSLQRARAARSWLMRAWRTWRARRELRHGPTWPDLRRRVLAVRGGHRVSTECGQSSPVQTGPPRAARRPGLDR